MIKKTWICKDCNLSFEKFAKDKRCPFCNSKRIEKSFRRR